MEDKKGVVVCSRRNVGRYRAVRRIAGVGYSDSFHDELPRTVHPHTYTKPLSPILMM